MTSRKNSRMTGRYGMLPVLALLALALLAVPARAGDTLLHPTVIDALRIAQGVGMSMAGDKYENRTTLLIFATRPKVSGFLTANDAHLERVGLAEASTTRLVGSWTYSNELGRSAHYGYAIDYMNRDGRQYLVRDRVVTPFEPLSPRAELYFVPAGEMTAKQMRAMPTDRLLAYARERADRVVPDGPPQQEKEYDVLCFCMDRLMDGAKWELTMNGQPGDSWSSGGWHVARVQARMALNAQKGEAFAAYHTRAPKSLEGGARTISAIFSNQYFRPELPQPLAEVPMGERTAALKAAYAARQLPNELTD